MKNRLGLDAQLTIPARQNRESHIEADAGNFLTHKVQVHAYHPAGSG